MQRGKLDEAERDAALGPADRSAPGSTTWPTSTWSSRPSSRSSTSSRRCSRTSTRSAGRARSWRPRPRRCPVVECAVATQRPGDVVGPALLQPGAGDAAGRGRAHRLDRARRRGHGAGGRASGSASTRSICGDRSGFIVNALLFPYLNDAVKMLQAHYAGGRGHRHRDEDRLRLPDGAVRAARRRRAGRVPGHPARALPGVPRAAASRRRRCSSSWSRRATWAARPAAGSAPTPERRGPPMPRSNRVRRGGRRAGPPPARGRASTSAAPWPASSAGRRTRTASGSSGRSTAGSRPRPTAARAASRRSRRASRTSWPGRPTACSTSPTAGTGTPPCWRARDRRRPR